MTANTDRIKTNAQPTQHPSGLSATLYFRSGTSGAVRRRQEDLRRRFEALTRQEERIDLAIDHWAETVVTPVGDGDPAAAVATYRDVAAAVADAEGRLEPFFDIDERDGGLLVGGPDGERIRFPVSALVVRRDGDVSGAYPCWLDGEHHSVEDGLEALRGGQPENLA